MKDLILTNNELKHIKMLLLVCKIAFMIDKSENNALMRNQAINDFLILKCEKL